MKKEIKIDQNEVKQRKKIVRDAEIIASLDNNAEHSDYYKELNQKWINGEISSNESLNLLIKHYKK